MAYYTTCSNCTPATEWAYTTPLHAIEQGRVAGLCRKRRKEKVEKEKKNGFFHDYLLRAGRSLNKSIEKLTKVDLILAGEMESQKLPGRFC
jgi:hypothetical protein